MRQKNLMTITAVALLIAAMASSCKKLGDKQLILENPAEFEQADAPVVVKRQMITEKFGPVPVGQTLLVLDEKGDTIPSQLDDVDNDGKWDEMAFVHDFAPMSKDTLTMKLIDTTDAPSYSPRTNIRFVTLENPGEEIQEAERLDYEQTGENEDVYQMEGPAWENDKVGFRNYFDPRNGIDIFGKTTDEMVLDDAGIEGQDYHEMDKWGMDILKVGRSLGAGAIGLKVNDSLIRIGPDSKGTFTRVFEGPVRSRLQLTFDDIEISGNNYRVIHDITNWPGKYGYKGSVRVEKIQGDEQLIIGIVNMEVDSLTMDNPYEDYVSLITHNKQTINQEYLGMGLLVEKSGFVASGKAPLASEEASGIVDTYYAIMDLTDQPINYHFYAGWEKSASKFADEEKFVEYVRKEAQKAAQPISVVK